MKNLTLFAMLLSSQVYASAIYVSQINCHKNYANAVADIFENKHHIPSELIETECVESCEEKTKNKKPIHLCLNHADELVVLNWNYKFVESSLKIFKSFEQKVTQGQTQGQIK